MYNARFILLTLLSLILSCISPALLADLIMSAPPRESPAAGTRLYQPIADHISRVTGQKIVYEHPQTWLNYQKQMRNKRYDIVFDGPHFMSWRINHSQHIPLVKLPGRLRFVIITLSVDEKLRSVNDLIGKRICGLAPPNLATLVVYAEFPNPVRQPNFVAIPGGFNNVLHALKDKRCDAAVFRDSFYLNKMSAEDRTDTRIIFTSAALPNQGITVNTMRMNPDQQKKVLESFMSSDGILATRPLLDRFAKNASALLPTSAAEYKDHNRYIEGVIFGW